MEDSPHFLRLLENENSKGPQSKDTFPVTVDVSSLYTSIPANGDSGGLQAFEKALNKRPQCEKDLMPTDFLMECLDLVLKGNIFMFNDDLFIQRIGTAMGTRVAPTYACIFMGWLETQFLSEWSGVQPNLWKRYIDDIFFLWGGTVDDLQLFIQQLNLQRKYIKYIVSFDTETRSRFLT